MMRGRGDAKVGPERPKPTMVSAMLGYEELPMDMKDPPRMEGSL